MKSFSIYREQTYPFLDVPEKHCTRLNPHLCDEVWISVHTPTCAWHSPMCHVLRRVWLCAPTVCSPPGSSVCGILPARVLQWLAISSSRGIFPNQGSNLSLLSFLHFRWILYLLSHFLQSYSNPALRSLRKSRGKFSLPYNGSPSFSRKTNIPESNEAKPTDLWPWLPVHWGGHQNLAGKPPGFESSSSGNSTQDSLLKPRAVFFGGEGGGGTLPVCSSGTFTAQGGGSITPAWQLCGGLPSPLSLPALHIICDLELGKARIGRTSFYEPLSRFFLPSRQKHRGWCPGSLCAWRERAAAIRGKNKYRLM